MSSDDITKLIALGIPILIIILGVVGRIWCYTSEKLDTRLQSLNTATSKVSEAIKETSITTKEAEEAFKTFKEALDTPLLTTNELREKCGYDKIKEQLENSRYGIAYIDSNTTIEPISPPKEYCQCDYCGTFYTEFISNCKNCGAVIRKPGDFGKLNCIIKTSDLVSRQELHKRAEVLLYDKRSIY